MSTFLFRKGHPSGAPAGMPWDAPRPIHIIEHEDGPKSTECGPNIEDPFAPKKNLGSGDWDDRNRPPWVRGFLGQYVEWGHQIFCHVLLASIFSFGLKYLKLWVFPIAWIKPTSAGNWLVIGFFCFFSNHYVFMRCGGYHHVSSLFSSRLWWWSSTTFQCLQYGLGPPSHGALTVHDLARHLRYDLVELAPHEGGTGKAQNDGHGQHIYFILP